VFSYVYRAPRFDDSQCEAFGRHKTYVVDPKFIKEDIKWAEITQSAGEAMVVLPRVVHYGFNFG